MHGLQNQCSCLVPLQPRSCSRSGAPFSSFTSQQTPHAFPGRGCGASPSDILGRGFFSRNNRVSIWECARFGAVRCGGERGGSSSVGAACPCVWYVAGVCVLVMDGEVVIHTAWPNGCLLGQMGIV